MVLAVTPVRIRTLAKRYQFLIDAVSFFIAMKGSEQLAAKKNPLSDKAYELYKSGMKLVDIADQLGKPEGTIRRWKNTYNWDAERSDCKANENERSTSKQIKKQKCVDDGTKATLQNDDLTPEQQMFCIYYSKTFNAAQSYQKAYGCQYTTAVAHGYELLSNVVVRAEIERLKEIKRQQIIAGADDIVELQMRIAFGDIGDALEFTQEERELPDGNSTMVNVLRAKDSSMLDTQLIKSVTEGRNGLTVVMKDEQKAIEWLSKYFLMHPDDKYKAEFDKKRAEVKDDTADQILQNMKTITDILQTPAGNRSIDDFEGVSDDE